MTHYKLVYTKKAMTDINLIKFNEKQLLKIILEELRSEPFKSAKKLLNKQFGTYRLILSNYRVIFDVQDENIIILRAGNRHCIYH
jgi:mRNA interferase RelE/StbE